MLKHLNIGIFGRVQGVAFRHHTQLKADALHLYGFVRNEPDGSVYIEIEGEKESLDQFVDWCHQGSPRSEVNRVEVKTGNLKYFSNFNVY